MDFIEIDGSSGEGGGQIIRTSIGLSCITKKPVRIKNIRTNRPQPGLKQQHLKGAEAAAKLSNAKVKGLSAGSTNIEFIPGEIKGRFLSINIGTAGSIGLVLQTLMLPALFAEKKVSLSVTGGTNVSWSPSVDFIKNTKLAILEKFGYIAEITLEKRGYYPKGGGKVEAVIESADLKKIDLTDPGNLERIFGISHSSAELEKPKVSERMEKTAREILYNSLQITPEIKKEYSSTDSTDCGIEIFAQTKNSVLGSSFLGKPGKKAEVVGKEAAEFLLKQISSGAALDEHMADQILPYMALNLGSKVTVPQLTDHAETNISIIEKFLPVKFKIKKTGKYFTIECKD